MKACFPHLKESQGTVVHFASQAGLIGNWGMVGYNAAKEASRALTRTAAREWAPYNISVNCIIPGMLTEGSKEFFDANPEHYKHSLSNIPLRRLGDPENDAGTLVVFLALGRKMCKELSGRLSGEHARLPAEDRTGQRHAQFGLCTAILAANPGHRHLDHENSTSERLDGLAGPHQPTRGVAAPPPTGKVSPTLGSRPRRRDLPRAERLRRAKTSRRPGSLRHRVTPAGPVSRPM
jgi:hypothetical protein